MAEDPADGATMMSARLQPWREEKTTGKSSCPGPKHNQLLLPAKNPDIQPQSLTLALHHLETPPFTKVWRETRGAPWF